MTGDTTTSETVGPSASVSESSVDPAPAPTTAAPSTVPPTTAAPTTVAPTTVAPTTASPTTAAPVTTSSLPPAPAAVTVVRVVDGDTVDVSSGQRIRIIGIDTPEQGQCGFAEAAARLRALVAGGPVTLAAGARDDADRYGRLLRYVDTVDGIDVGLALIEEDLAISRYDSRDGYGRHDREANYVATDDGVLGRCAGAPTAAPPATGGSASNGGSAGGPAVGGVHYVNCTAARQAGAAPLSAGQPGYRDAMDRDRDGVACE